MRIQYNVIMVAAVLTAAPASATQQRSFVASDGADTHPCTIVAPCRSFAAAIAQTDDGGEVIVRDSGGYGPVTITKSIALIAPPGVYAGVSVFAGNGITINAPGKHVELRGLAINGQGGDNGIGILNVAHLRIERCVVSGMAKNGIIHTADDAEIVMLDSIVHDNVGAGFGIIASNVTANLSRVRSEHNEHDGFDMTEMSGTGSFATVSESVALGNGGHGIRVQTLGQKINVTVERSVLARNALAGVHTEGMQASVFLSHNTISNNGTAMDDFLGGTIYSTHSNTVVGPSLSTPTLIGFQ